MLNKFNGFDASGTKGKLGFPPFLHPRIPRRGRSAVASPGCGPRSGRRDVPSALIHPSDMLFLNLARTPPTLAPFRGISGRGSPAGTVSFARFVLARQVDRIRGPTACQPTFSEARKSSLTAARKSEKGGPKR